jgi:hypothetical protein
MNDLLQTSDGSRSTDRRIERNALESQVSLQRAVRTLRAILQRYEMDRVANSHTRSHSIQVALGDTDMCWIAAAIKVLEQSIARGATEAAAGAAAQAHPET